MEDRIEYFERMLADNPDNPTSLLALAHEHNKARRYEDKAAVLQALRGYARGRAY